MNKVKWVYTFPHSGLTQNKVYDVIQINHNEYLDIEGKLTQPGVVVEDDKGMLRNIRLWGFDGLQIFEDVTKEYRNEVINEILS